MARRKQWGQLSKAARDRATRAGARYGLNRNAVRQRYNRGTYNPLSTNPLMRLPREIRERAAPGGTVDWQELALDNMRSVLSDYYKYNDDAVVYYTQNMSDNLAQLTATASEDELLKWASMQPDAEGNPPPIEDWGLPPGVSLDDVSVYVNGQWNNVFWYH